jgi:hypothetical protein
MSERDYYPGQTQDRVREMFTRKVVAREPTQDQIHAAFARGELTAAEAADATIERQRADGPKLWHLVAGAVLFMGALIGLGIFIAEAYLH